MDFNKLAMEIIECPIGSMGESAWSQTQVGKEEVIFDYSRQNLDTASLQTLLKTAEIDLHIGEKVEKLFKGEVMNVTEQRKVWHMACRSHEGDVCFDAEVAQVRERVKVFSDLVRNGSETGATGKKIDTVVGVGIGGSYLGVECIYEALKELKEEVKLLFVANVDPAAAQMAMSIADPETTLVIVISKTFTTAETLLNAKSLKQWFLKSLSGKADTATIVQKHFAAASTNVPAAGDFGISADRVFPFADWVGGRYSVTSTVGVLPLSLVLGYNVVTEFLDGARAGDLHFYENRHNLTSNIPAIMGILSHFNLSLGRSAVAVLPYAQKLGRLAAHIQQLCMESNGKRVKEDGSEIECLETGSGEVYFGEPGTDSQHSFFQLLHQGRVCQCEFIGFINNKHDITGIEPISNHYELMCNFFAQPDALAYGKKIEDVKRDVGNNVSLIPHKSFPGNRPSTVLLLNSLSPSTMGIILSFYEHRTAMQGWLFGVNSFDQFGVELGKVLAKEVRQYLLGKKEISEFNPCTQRSLNYFCKHAKNV